MTRQGWKNSEINIEYNLSECRIGIIPEMVHILLHFVLMAEIAFLAILKIKK